MRLHPRRSLEILSTPTSCADFRAVAHSTSSHRGPQGARDSAGSLTLCGLEASSSSTGKVCESSRPRGMVNAGCGRNSPKKNVQDPEVLGCFSSFSPFDVDGPPSFRCWGSYADVGWPNGGAVLVASASILLAIKNGASHQLAFFFFFF
eukprot:GHVS01038646.1.p1 GENE.GHVS01038646.1~~GHVS01038646.1.p1  ORF type:complete len:149 (-),score=10.09 GHVS01038646.1:5-451(-)